MDNLISTKVSGVRKLIEKAKAELLYLPPYSPDLNPIEKAWASSNNCSAQPNCENALAPPVPISGEITVLASTPTEGVVASAKLLVNMAQ